MNGQSPIVNRLTAFACLALSMTLVGSYVGLSKSLVAVFPVFLLAWLRFGIGGLAMLPWLRKPADEPVMSLQTRRLVFLESLLGNFLFSICMLYGVSLTSAVAAGIIMASIPACVALMSWLFLRERIGPRVWAAVACAVLGVSLVSLSKSELLVLHSIGLEANLPTKNALPQALWGNVLLMAAVLCESAYAVIGKKLTRVLGPKRITSLINLWGLALVTPLGVYQALDFNFGHVSTSTWGLLVFYALAASVWTVWLWMTGLKTIPASQAGVFTVMLPVSAALVGVVFLDEHIDALQLLALGIGLLGVVLATLAPSPSAQHVGRQN
jgi:drug/metabolite transporter (DMT)-like permease